MSSRPCRITLYSRPRSTYVVTMREPSTVSSVRPTVSQRHAEVGRAVAVDRHANLRLALLVVAPDVREARVLLRELQELIRPDRELLVVRAAEHGLDRRLQAAAAEAAGLAELHASRRAACAPSASTGCGDLPRRALAVVPVLQDQEAARRVHVAGAQVRAALARNADQERAAISPFSISFIAIASSWRA